MSKNYSMCLGYFNIGVAQRLKDVIKAILIHDIACNIDHSVKVDGNCWVRGGFEGFKEYYPYISNGTLNRKLKELEDSGILKSHNHNQSKYDKTKWYAIIDTEILDSYCINNN